MKRILFVLGLTLLSGCINDIDFPLDPVACWDFSGEGTNAFISSDKNHFKLLPGNDSYPQITETKMGGVLKNIIHFDGKKDWLYIPYEITGPLNIKTGEVTIIALIRWEEKANCFVAGMWNEYASGGKRQYGLFVSLPYYNGNRKVCGHISRNGGPTPPFPYSIDYSTSASDVEDGAWHYVAMTYDGKYIKSYYDGVFEEVRNIHIDNTKGFEGYPDGLVQDKNPYYFPDGLGSNGSDFTIGAVELTNGMGNFFKGDIAEISVFNRCLSSNDINKYINDRNSVIKRYLKELNQKTVFTEILDLF